jgi:hypothetical protein
MDMFKGPDDSYRRFNPESIEATLDRDLYTNDDYYRDSFKAKMSEARYNHLKVVAQDIKSFAKLWSLLDEKVLTLMRRDASFISDTVESKRPYRLRRLIVTAANSKYDIIHQMYAYIRTETQHLPLGTWQSALKHDP